MAYFFVNKLKAVIQMNKYVPLHVHTSRNSIGDSILKLNSYIDKAKELGLDTLCITGHGSLADMYDFYLSVLIMTLNLL